MKKNSYKLPIFNNIQEIEQFWSSHEFTEFQGDFVKASDIEFDIKNRTYLPVTTSMFEKLEKIANEQQTTVDRLLHHWIEEKLAEL